MKTLPAELKENKKLKSLSLTFISKLKNFEVLKYHKKNLKFLELRTSELRSVPSILTELKGLEEFNMKATYKFKDISNLKNMPNLKKLSLGCLENRLLSKNLNSLKNLEELFIWKSWNPSADELIGLKKLKSIDSVSSLKNAKSFIKLERLKIQSNKGVDLSGISSSKSLKILELYVPNLKVLPASLFLNKKLIA